MPSNYDPNVHHRRSIRLKEFDYTGSDAYFVTICTDRRLCVLANARDGSIGLTVAGRIVKETWLSLPRRFSGLELDAFVVMPNHVHGVLVLAAIDDGKPPLKASLGEVIRTLKAASTRLIRTAELPDFAWQRNYYEHVVRNDSDLQRIRDYIEANPANWGDDPENPAVDKVKLPSRPTNRPWAR